MTQVPPSASGYGSRWADRLLGHPLACTLLCTLSGTLLFLACADFDIWPLCWIGLVPLLVCLLDADGMPQQRRPALYGFITGLLANGGGFYWIVGLLMRFGHMPFVAALPIFLLLIAYQAITFALFASLLCRLRAQIDLPVTFLAPLCWTACELCVPYIFPWYLSITQAWVPPVIQIAEWTGPLGVSFLLVLSNGALFDLYAALRRRRAATPRPAPLYNDWPALSAPIFAAVLIAANLVYGVVRIHQVQAARAQAPKVKIGVVQANIGIHEKFDPRLADRQLLVHQRLSAELEQRGAQLLVWPESSYPYVLPRTLVTDLPERDQRMVRRGLHGPLLFGALTLDPRGAPYNTALMMDAAGQVTASFDKNFLLVFGEYIPYAEHMAWLRELIPEISNFARGTTTTTFPLSLHGVEYQLGPMICYEDIIPAFGRRLFDGSRPPQLLVNITNDAWFGATSEPYEHMALSVYRAIEHRVDLVRAVNTGVSVFIDATGKVYDRTRAVDPQLEQGVAPMTLLNDAALLQPGGFYQRLGESFGGACLALVLAMGALARRRAGRSVRWRWLLGGALGLHLLLLLGGLVLPGASLREVYAAIFHRSEGSFPEAAMFTATWHGALLLVLGSAVLGVVLAIQGRRDAAASLHEARSGAPQGRLEALWAIACVTIVPVMFFGRVEGNTGSMVLLSLLCMGVCLLGGRLART